MTRAQQISCALAFAALVPAPVWGAEADLLASLRRGHPRLLADATTWTRLGARQKGDARLAAFVHDLQAHARSLLAEPPVEHRKVGRRLLAMSRSALERILVLAFAYRTNGERVFLQRAEREMLAVAAFPDWNPSHFLDVAEMTAALALGYDWLFEELAPEARAMIRRAIVEKGLRPGLDPKAPHNGWHSRENNWNQVCFGGLTLGALAVADDEPALARETLVRARAGIVHGLLAYVPDGVYPEGPGYWSYGTSYQVLMIGALESALGTDWGLASSPGFLPSAGAYLQTSGPTGLLYNFADGSEQRGLEPVLFWFARRLGDDGLLQQQLRLLDALLAKPRGAAGGAKRLMALAAQWWPDSPKDAAPRLPRFWIGRGKNPIAVFRSSWTDPEAFYLGLKGGAAELNHAHMDAGSFVLERDGVRWARELGAQDYESLESKGIDLWNRSQDSQRWQVFRLNNHSHNTLTIDGRLHRVKGMGRIVSFSDAEAAPLAVVDLSAVFAGQAERVERGFRIVGGRAVLVQDELRGLKPGASVCWAMLTGAQVEVAGAHATLRENGRLLEARLLAPAASFSVVPADPPRDSFNAPNPGRRILTVTLPAAADGTLRIAVLLGASAGAAPPALDLIERWSARQVP